MLKSFLNTKNSKIVAGNYLALLFIQGANILLPLFTLPYLIRTIGTERFGLVMIAQSIGVFLTIVVDFGFNISATREVSLLRKNREKLSQLYWNIFYIKSALVVLAFMVLVLMVITIPRFRSESLVYILSFGMVLGQAIFPTWFFQGIEKMKVIITESQYKKVLIREFGEMENDPKKWYRKILKWVDGDRSRLKFNSDSYEVVAYDDKGIYLG
ncbi:oligosaccharide flippase family protein, partial [uncultured Dokdonia sp.]|uniref:oligosaccharide flippase family protein n=1 Tax=uncultured Dokdonia sp. TaxID=575653 RepID=UPI002606A8D5